MQVPTIDPVDPDVGANIGLSFGDVAVVVGNTHTRVMRSEDQPHSIVDSLFGKRLHSIPYPWPPMLHSQDNTVPFTRFVEARFEAGSRCFRDARQRSPAANERVATTKLLDLIRRRYAAVPDVRVVRFDVVKRVRRSIGHEKDACLLTPHEEN